MSTGTIKTINLSHTSALAYYPGFLGESAAHDLMQDLVQSLPWQQEKIKMFGKEVLQPRLTAWVGIGASASSRYASAIAASPWSKDLRNLKSQIEDSCQKEFNSVLVNYYRDGTDSMGFHSDDEPVLGTNPVIASVSLGGERKIIFKDRDTSTTKLEIILENGSLLVMKGTTQHEFKHGINKSKTFNEPRVNLTFRWMHTEQLRNYQEFV